MLLLNGQSLSWTNQIQGGDEIRLQKKKKKNTDLFYGAVMLVVYGSNKVS
jgi:hypothetical protein